MSHRKNKQGRRSVRGRRSAPIEITEGSVTVKIYYTPARLKLSTINQKPSTRLYPSWTLKYWLSGQLVRKRCSDLGKLTIEAQNAARRIANAQTATLTMTDAQVAEYVAAREKLSSIFHLPSSIKSLIGAADQAVELTQILQGKATPQQTAREWLDRNRNLTPITVSKLNEEFLAAKTKQRCDSRHLKDLRVRLDVFAEHFQCNVSHIAARDVQDWLDGLGRTGASPVRAGAPPASLLGAQTKLNYLRAVKNAFTYAKSRGYLPRDWNELAEISPGILPETIVTIYTPAEMERILRGAIGQIDLADKVTWPVGTPSTASQTSTKDLTHEITPADRTAFTALVPYIALGAFAGLRTAERCRTHWTDFNWDTGNIHVTGKRTRGRTTRSTSRRLVPINDTLRDWVADYVPKKGTAEESACIVPVSEQIAIRKFALLCRAVGIEPKDNALRHSFITYRTAEVKGNKHQVATESGNSPTTIEKHYLELVTAQQAAAWFGIRREPAANVTQLRKSA